MSLKHSSEMIEIFGHFLSRFVRFDWWTRKNLKNVFSVESGTSGCIFLKRHISDGAKASASL